MYTYSPSTDLSFTVPQVCSALIFSSYHTPLTFLRCGKEVVIQGDARLDDSLPWPATSVIGRALW